MIEHLRRIVSPLASFARSGRGLFVCSLMAGLALGTSSLVCLEAMNERAGNSNTLREAESGSAPPGLAGSTRRAGGHGEGEPKLAVHEPTETAVSKGRELEEELEEITAAHSGDYGVMLWQPASGTTVAVGAEDKFRAASLAKIPVLLALHREAARGSLDLEERVRMSGTDIQEGTGAMRNLPPGTSLTLRQCAEYLIRESDNTAWSMLEDRLGEARIRSELSGAGARSTSYEYARHSTTPEDTLKLLRRVSDPGYTSPRHSREMLAYMTDTAFEDWLPQGVPEDARIAHKIGILGVNFGDAGIVFPPREDSEKRYYVVVLAKETTEPDASAAMQEISLAAYRSLVNPEARPRPAPEEPGLAFRE